jgi:hypothetical protein
LADFITRHLKSESAKAVICKASGVPGKKGLPKLTILTAVELNDQHGTGIFGRNLFDDSSQVNVFYSKLIYGGGCETF